jgi:lactate permease
MAALVATAPLALIVLLMALWRWSAASAGLVGLVAAMVGAIGFFGFGTSIHGEQGIVGALIGTGAEAAFSAVDILWIILPALSLYELQQRSGAIDAIRTGLISLSSDKTLLAIIIAWFFASFMEGAAGFGTPIALAAPLLVSLGFTPVVAVALPLIGHVAGTSFGALGTPIFAQADVSGISGNSIAPPTALLHASLAPLLVLSIVFVAGTGRFQAKYAAWAIVAAVCFLLPYLVLAVWVGPELPTIGGALAGGSAFAFVLRRMHAQRAETLDARSLAIAALPYVVLVGLILVTRLVPQIRDPLRQVVLEWALPGPFGGRIEPLYHPGTMLFAGSSRRHCFVRDARHCPADGPCGHDRGAGCDGHADRSGVAAACSFSWGDRLLHHRLHNRLQYPPHGSSTGGGRRSRLAGACIDRRSRVRRGYRQLCGSAQHDHRGRIGRPART